MEKLGRYVDWEESQIARRGELLAEAETENPGSEANRGRIASAVDSIEEEAKKRRTIFYDVARDIGIDIVE